MSSPPALWSSDYKKKVIPPAELAGWAEGIKAQKRKITTLNGSFDLLHAGHLQIIYEASQVGDVLIVALNTDHSIRQYKSPTRPIIPLEYRLQMMAALGFVDYVTWFDETTPCHILSLIKPDIHVNGIEYGHNCIEAETIHRHGGKMHIVQLIPGLSTSSIITKIREGDSSCA